MVDTSPSRSVLFSQSNLLELSRAQMPSSGVPPTGIVEALDVLEDPYPHALPTRPRVSMEQLPLEGGDERLGQGVVESVSDRSHRRQEPLEDRTYVPSRRVSTAASRSSSTMRPPSIL